jgi:hypothetical protein
MPSWVLSCNFNYSNYTNYILKWYLRYKTIPSCHAEHSYCIKIWFVRCVWLGTWWGHFYLNHFGYLWGIHGYNWLNFYP